MGEFANFVQCKPVLAKVHTSGHECTDFAKEEATWGTWYEDSSGSFSLFDEHEKTKLPPVLG